MENTTTNKIDFDTILIEKTNYKDAAIEFARQHVQAALIRASQKGTATFHSETRYNESYTAIDTDSILNAYPLENIK